MYFIIAWLVTYKIVLYCFKTKLKVNILIMNHEWHLVVGFINEACGTRTLKLSLKWYRCTTRAQQLVYHILQHFFCPWQHSTFFRSPRFSPGRASNELVQDYIHYSKLLPLHLVPEFSLITSSKKVCHSSHVSTPTAMSVCQPPSLQRPCQPRKNPDLMSGTRLQRHTALWDEGHHLPCQAVFTQSVAVASVVFIKRVMPIRRADVECDWRIICCMAFKKKKLKKNSR